MTRFFVGIDSQVWIWEGVLRYRIERFVDALFSASVYSERVHFGHSGRKVVSWNDSLAVPSVVRTYFSGKRQRKAVANGIVTAVEQKDDMLAPTDRIEWAIVEIINYL